MKRRITHLLPVCLVFLAACEDKKEEKALDDKVSEVGKALADADMPMLPVKKGDFWKYSVRTEIPASLTTVDSAPMDVTTQMIRKYIGKIDVPGKASQVDTFEVKTPGQPVQHEFVEIYDNGVMMRGSMFPEQPDAKPVWMEPAVLFVFAGMRPGQESANVSIFEGAANREIQVVARESITVPADDFNAIRLLMTGNDEDVVIRKTTWFAPKIGIVKEETVRYVGDKLIFRNTMELVETSMKAE